MLTCSTARPVILHSLSWSNTSVALSTGNTWYTGGFTCAETQQKSHHRKEPFEKSTSRARQRRKQHRMLGRIWQKWVRRHFGVGGSRPAQLTLRRTQMGGFCFLRWGQDLALGWKFLSLQHLMYSTHGEQTCQHSQTMYQTRIKLDLATLEKKGAFHL